MLRALTYTLPFVLPLAWLAAYLAGGAWWWLVPAVAFVAVPALDAWVGDDAREPDEAPSSWFFDGALFAWLPAQLLCMGLGVASAVAWSPGVLLGMAVACGLLTGAGGFTVAHELMHRKGRAHRAVAEVLCAVVSYPWFTVEHLLGHHKNVATPRDPASSRLGQSVYPYLVQTITGGLRSAWHLETQRVSTRGVRGLADRRVRHALWFVVVPLAAIAIGGLPGLVFYAVQAAVAVVLLEVVNYVEHYGLERSPNATGRYERVAPHHSWNSNRAVTNRFLFNLQRHADHHAYAYRRYDQLRPWPDAPELPYGYPTMVLMALVPPLWRRVMDPRAKAWRARYAANAA